MLIAFGLTACAGTQVERIPPVSRAPTHRHDIGKFVWHDLMTSDVEGARKFYGTLFNWKFDASEDPEYVVITNHSKPIGGIIHVTSSESGKKRNRWLASMSVKSVDEAAEFTRTSGGLIYEKPQTIPDRGRLAIVSDPQDAIFVLLFSQSGDPPEHPIALNEWMWDELWTNDKKDAIEFYTLLAGYTHEVVTENSGQNYDIFKTGSEPRAGVATIARNSVRPMWISYIRVDNPKATVETARKLGGKVILDPTEDFKNGSIGIVSDPEGGIFAVQKWTGGSRSN